MESPLLLPTPDQPRRKRWTRAECAILEGSGLIDPMKFELIGGELIDKMGKYRPHVDALALVVGWLIQLFGVRHVNTEAPIDVAPEDNPTNEPQPDAIVLRPSYKGFKTAVPQPADLLLVIEVASSSLGFDLATKAALYARAGIIEYWVLDTAGQRILVHRNPENGRYIDVIAYDRADSVSTLAKPTATLPVASVFPE